jgi:ADP-ribose pyrophosphatase YjhB (NUDIX family)
MWLFTPFGFFSVVHKAGDSGLTVRSRVRSDLLRLQRHYLPAMSAPQAHAGSDYPWRARCSHEDLAQALQKIARHIDYANFKDEVALSTGKARAQRYGQVWQALHGMHEDCPEPVRQGDEGLPWTDLVPAGKQRAFGGVVIDPEGRLLLREVAGHGEAEVWTYAKGRPEPGESPRQAALREVQEKMGVAARIVLPLPSTFEGRATHTQFFLMVVDPSSVDLSHRCKQTQRLCWAVPEEARRLMAQTPHPLGRQRDLQVLEEALRFLPSPLPLQRPIARREDWPFRPMPAERAELDFRARFTPAEMAKVARGFLSQVMEHKWCAWFEDGVLRIHRSWSGHEIFRLHLEPVPERAGHWAVVRTEYNCHPGQWTLDERESLESLHTLIDSFLLNLGGGSAADACAQGLAMAAQPNHLGRPAVVQALVKALLDAVVEDAMTVGDGGAPERAARALVAAMTDDPAYARLPWHSREQLGEVLIDCMNLPPDPQKALGLSRVLERALSAAQDAALELARDVHADSAEAEFAAWAHRLEALGDFVVAVFLGTHTLSHPGQRLDRLVACRAAS